VEAELLLSILRRFPGYTLTTLLAEDARLLQLLAIEARGNGG
jgi:hypothetical protein